MEGAPSSSPRVSVVVPVYNRELFVGATIESVLAQTFTAWELVVFDDGSTDQSWHLARRYAAADPRVRVGRGPNGGVATARNRGLALSDARTEFVVFLDSDDIWEPDMLESLVGMLDAHPEHVSAYCLARCVDSEGRFLPDDDLAERTRHRWGLRHGKVTTLTPDDPVTFDDLIVHHWMVTPGTHLLRRRVLELVGAFDPAADPADDFDLALRMSRHGCIGCVDRPLLRWRRHDQTLSNTSTRWGAASRYVKAKALSDPSNTTAQRDAVRRSYHLEITVLLEEAGAALRTGSARAATKQTLKACQLYGSYLRASTLTRLGHR